jgi:predicted cupin superfamily sugar epimerase
VTHDGREFAAYSSIYYLLTRDQPVNFVHGLASDDIHTLIEGGPVDYYFFYPDGRTGHHVLGPDRNAGHQQVLTMPGGGWKALRLHDGVDHALMSNVLTPEWTPDRVSLPEPETFLNQFTGREPWATRDFLESLLATEPLAPLEP